MQYYVENPNGATVSIFVPYDCDNSCPFCINKKEYVDTSNFNLQKILDSIVEMDKISPNCDFVLTGGEPFTFSKIDILWTILETIKHCRSHHKLYINTTLPVKTAKDYSTLMKTLSLYKGVITGLNVSRHAKHNVKVFRTKKRDVEMLKEIQNACPLRINCVLYNDTAFDFPALRNFKNVYDGFNIQFRKDYVKTTYEDLVSVNKEFVRLRYIYDALQCKTKLKRGVNRVNWEVCPNVSYHVTLPYSRIPTENDGQILVDIIINQCGDLLDDWNDYGKKLDIEQYKQRKVLTKEML